MILKVLSSLLLVQTIHAAVIQLPTLPNQPPSAIASVPSPNQLSVVQAPPAYREIFHDQTLDHFNYNDDRTFPQRFLLNDEWFNPNEGSIFFYAGSQENIVESWNNDLFLMENAARFKAMIVFAEHRFYGKSMPFGNRSLEINNIVFLTIEQALADYAKLIVHLKDSYHLTSKQNYVPVVTFGAAYGGMLSAHLRIKYPTIIDGSVASAAPMNLLSGHAVTYSFYRDVTKAYQSFPNCVAQIRTAFDLVQQIFKQPQTPSSNLQQRFKLCKAVANERDFRQLTLFLRNALTMLAVNNYPYSRVASGYNFAANPVKTACDYLNANSRDLLAAMRDVVSNFYNKTAPLTSCFDTYAEIIECSDSTGCLPGSNNIAFDYQSCTEIPIIQNSNYLTDMFPTTQYSEIDRKDYCRRKWNVTVRENLSFQFWNDRVAKSATNLLFFDSMNDPWQSLGVSSTFGDSISMVKINEGAHRIDLRASNSNDSPAVKMARLEEIKSIEKWINHAKKQL